MAPRYDDIEPEEAADLLRGAALGEVHLEYTQLTLTLPDGRYLRIEAVLDDDDDAAFAFSIEAARQPSGMRRV